MIKYIQEGDDIDYTPSSATDAGVGVLIGSMFGVTKRPLAASEAGALSVVGVFELAKSGSGSISFAVGDKVYFDVATQLATSVSTDNPLIGLAVESAGTTATTMRCRLQPQGA